MKQYKTPLVCTARLTTGCRAIYKPGVYSILPAANRAASTLPYFTGVQVQVLAAPPMGAHFVEHELVIQPGGGNAWTMCDDLEQFLYVLEGGIELIVDGKAHRMERGGFCWLPADCPNKITNRGAAVCRLLWIRRRYEKVVGVAVPAPIIAHERDVISRPTDTYMEKHLTPYEDLAFDMGINLQMFDPGVCFSSAESHIMEHGLYMVEGRGVYWLNRDFNETQQDDFIYMAPYCPQFFHATGCHRSTYLLYKDVNRDYVMGL